MFRGERCDLRFASKKGAALPVNPSAVNHAPGGNEIAGQRGERDRWKFSLQSLRQIETGNQRDVAQQMPDDRFERGRRVNLFGQGGSGDFTESEAGFPRSGDAVFEALEHFHRTSVNRGGGDDHPIARPKP